MRIVPLIALALFAAPAPFSSALSTPAVATNPSPNSSPQQSVGWVRLLSPQEVSIAAGKPAVVELRFVIASKLHINSHTPPLETLIPTRLAVTEVPGLKVAAVDFPAGEPFVIPLDPTTKLDVYTGEFVLKVHVLSQPGSHLLQGVLRYQACDNSACYPPKTLPVAVNVLAQ